MSNQTGTEIKLNFISLMGDDLGRAYFHLYNEVIFLHHKWITYLDLFATEKERLNLLNESAPYFFYIVQKGLFENIIMSIGRITDPHEMKKSKQRNCTLSMLNNLVTDIKLKSELELQLKWYIEDAVAFARNLRHKKFGHSDYDISTGKAMIQEKAEIQDIETALKAIRQFMNTIINHYNETRTIFKHMSTNLGAKALLITLQDGKNAREFIRDLEICGKVVPETLLKNSLEFSEKHFELD